VGLVACGLPLRRRPPASGHGRAGELGVRAAGESSGVLGNVVMFTNLSATLSFGYAYAWGGDRPSGTEFMASLKIM